MTVKVFDSNGYLKTLEATVTGVEEAWLEFDKTLFYPEGGGQPGDTGLIKGVGDRGEQAYSVLDTRKGANPGSVRHQLDNPEHGLQVGDRVLMTLDWDRRYRHMRMHTCLHLLGSLIPVPVTGGAVGADKSRLDFDIGELQLDKDELTEGLNALIAAARDLKLETIEDAELDANPGFVRTMSVQPPRGSGSIRMVRIDAVDYQPCGGTHVRNTAEIGPVRVSKIENKGKRNRRIHVVFAEDNG
jgi:misacylated tRNA(Ala) deacylase